MKNISISFDRKRAKLFIGSQLRASEVVNLNKEQVIAKLADAKYKNDERLITLLTFAKNRMV